VLRGLPAASKPTSNIIGAGRDNNAKAGAALPSIQSASASAQFRAVRRHVRQERDHQNLHDYAYDYQLSVTGGGPGIPLLAVGHPHQPGRRRSTFTVFMAADKGATLGDHQGRLAVSGVVGDYAHAV
jgi:hypothetical protein